MLNRLNTSTEAKHHVCKDVILSPESTTSVTLTIRKHCVANTNSGDIKSQRSDTLNHWATRSLRNYKFV